METLPSRVSTRYPLRYAVVDVETTGLHAPSDRVLQIAATTERSLLLAHIYRRDGRWRLRAIGQGYDHGLADLATLHGVTVDDD
jgi:DNA polymerase III subunit epsilon